MHSFIAHRSCLLIIGLSAWWVNAISQTLPVTPTSEELFAARSLPEPLVPLGEAHTSSDNQRLSSALAAFESRKQPDDFSALEQFLAANPQSPWCLAVQMNLGLLYHHAGYFSKTMPAYLAAWETGKDATDFKAKALADRAAGEYTRMLVRLGRYAELKAFLKASEGRQFIGPATELMTAGLKGASLMETRPDMASRCGVAALGRILKAQGSPLQSSPLLANPKSSMQGISLTELGAISQTLGMNYQCAKRSPGAQLIIPSVIHWKIGHYAALLEEENGRYHAGDSTFGNDIWHTADALDAESSGYFLVPPGPLPAGWASVSETDANQIRGSWTFTNDPDDDTECDEKDGGDQKSCPVRMATYSFHTMLVSLNIKDTPAGYNPPYGPAVEFEVTYNQREAGQPSTFNYTNFGPKWTCNWLSYITDDPAVPATVSLAAGGGGTLRFSGYAAGSQSWAPQYKNQSTLVRTSSSPVRYEQTYPDGSKDVYAQSNGAVTAPRKVFLTQRIDPAGNAVTLTYDGQLRITQITDAIGQVTTLTYGLAGDVFKITKVTDPFGRHADFTYDASGRLILIQDVIGIQSQFAYSGTGDFINALTTPYGTTSFTTKASSTPDGAAVFRLTATDPNGDTEVLEFSNSTFLQPQSVAANQLPTGMVLNNTDMSLRNSYFWDKKAWKEAPNDHSKARLYHWHQYDGYNIEGDGTLESEKPPLENRIWYNYPGQAGASSAGSITQPSKIGRKLNDGTTELIQYTYNSLGMTTSSTDALGRITLYSYQPNNMDLQSVSQQQGAQAVLLASYTWNSQHRPLTATDAAGQVTTCTWNAVGQMTSMSNAKNETIIYTYYSTNDVGKQRRGRLQSIDGELPGSSDVTTFDYDAVGRVASVTGPDGYSLTYTYDALDRITRVTFPDATYTENTYLKLDPQTSRDRLGRITSYVYNSLRQLQSMTDPAGRTLSYEWCKCGDLKQITDALGRATTWKHDVEGRITAKKYPDGSGITYSYTTDAGRLESITDEKGQVKTFSYNLDGSMAGQAYANSSVPTASVTYTYDSAFRRLTSMTDGTGTTNYAYYPVVSGTLGAGGLASVDGPLPNDTIAYTYDELGDSVSRAVNGVSESSTYDAAGRLVSVVNSLGSFGYTYVGATGRTDTVTYPNNMTCVYGYQPLNNDFRLQSITQSLPGSVPVAQHTYAYDVQGRLTNWGIQNGGSAAVAFAAGHDNADRLTSFTSPASSATYTYDSANNRLTETINAVTANANYNVLNELTSINTTNTPPPEILSWDAEDRLVAIDYTGTNLRTEFTYDGLDRCVRIIEKTGGVVTTDRRFVWCGYARCEERDTTGSVVLRRFFPEGEQIGGVPFFYGRDHLGTVRQVTDGSTVRASYDYDAWGRRTKVAGDVDATFGFTGHLAHEPSGLTLAPLRAYDPKVGRWLNRDPIEERGGLNLFGYLNDDPLGGRDALGGWGPADALPFVSNQLAKLVKPLTDAMDEKQKKIEKECTKWVDDPHPGITMWAEILKGLVTGGPPGALFGIGSGTWKLATEKKATPMTRLLAASAVYTEYPERQPKSCPKKKKKKAQPPPPPPITTPHNQIPEPQPHKVDIYLGSEHHEAQFMDGRRVSYR